MDTRTGVEVAARRILCGRASSLPALYPHLSWRATAAASRPLLLRHATEAGVVSFASQPQSAGCFRSFAAGGGVRVECLITAKLASPPPAVPSFNPLPAPTGCSPPDP